MYDEFGPWKLVKNLYKMHPKHQIDGQQILKKRNGIKLKMSELVWIVCVIFLLKICLKLIRNKYKVLKVLNRKFQVYHWNMKQSKLIGRHTKNEKKTAKIKHDHDNSNCYDISGSNNHRGSNNDDDNIEVYIR